MALATSAEVTPREWLREYDKGRRSGRIGARYYMEDKIRVLISGGQVEERIREMAERMNEDYAGRSLHLVCAEGKYFCNDRAGKASDRSGYVGLYVGIQLWGWDGKHWTG